MKRTPSHETAPTSDTSCKFWVPRLPSLLSDLATRSEVPTTPVSGSVIHENDSQYSKKHNTQDYGYTTEAATQEQPDGRMHRATYKKSGDGGAELHAFSGCTILQAH